MVTQKGNVSCWDSECYSFSNICLVDSTVGCIDDNQKLCKNRNMHRQQDQNLFVKSAQIYHSMILNNNCIDDILCGHTFTVENSQSNEFITVVNAKSKVK